MCVLFISPRVHPDAKCDFDSFEQPFTTVSLSARSRAGSFRINGYTDLRAVYEYAGWSTSVQKD